MRDFLNYYNIKRLYILGAGFSVPANLPTVRDLLQLVHNTARRKSFYSEGISILKGQAEYLLEELQFYYPTLSFTHEMIENNHIPKNFDFENFLSYVSAESAFLQNTGEQWNEHGSRFLAWLKCWLAEAIYEKQMLAYNEELNLYNKFCEHIKNSLVMTFNWDTLLEYVFDNNLINYTYRPADIVRENKIPIVKLHGSIDWFTYPYGEFKKEWMSFEPISKETTSIFKAKGNLFRYYNNMMTPWIIIPSFDKISQLHSLGDIWVMPWRFLQNKLEIIIIGYSMRFDDYHSRAFIYPQLVHGSRSGDLSVKVIDYAKDNSEKDKIKTRFEGVENIKYFFDGFNEKALEFIES